MEKLRETTEFEAEILQEVNNLYGLNQEAKETLIGYLEYIRLVQLGKIEQVGNANIFIKSNNNCNYTNKIIELIFNTLKYTGITDDDNFYEVRQPDILNHLPKIKEKLIVISDNVNFLMRSTLDILQKFIKNNPQKIFIITFTPYIERKVPKIAPAEEMGKELCSWNIEIEGEYTQAEKQSYIENKLKSNHVRVSKNCNLIGKLAKEEINKIDNEILYLTVKSRANDRHIITDKFLEQIHRTQYITNKKNNGKSAMQELDELIGLEDIKKQIKQIINYVRINKERGQLPMLHMAFLGPAGVGKTEVARLVAKIFQEEGILQNDIVEATRENLVGAYIGHTAIKTKETINKALGGTLFIDERLLSYTKFRERLWK